MSLKAEIIAHIKAHGPMKLSDYMARCNAHYYATRVPFGKDGDFITAPEISQVFGELLGLWAADLWQSAGAPARFNLVELGPGRGTLMQDALRATAKVPGFHEAMRVHFVETSPILRDEQKQRVPQAKWHASVTSLPKAAPSVVIANEFFDALPIDQVRQDSFNTEQHITLEGEALAWTFKPDIDTFQSSLLMPNILADLFHPKKHAVALLIIDYGDRHIRGSSVQAVKDHEFSDVLGEPGEQDITALLDYAEFEHYATSFKLVVHGPITQGAFLRSLGLDMRTAQLARANPARGEELFAASARLADPDQMGELFKVMCITSAHWPKPAGFP
jgi:NADH dehydrogenase [ubiquinone] 1 alpha subcomplex assembly factor 7